jgi:molybdate transport system ATP-binding protein
MTLDVALRHSIPGFELDIAFSAPPGLTALFGRSGSGKTTIVNTVAGLVKPMSGRVAIDGSVLFDFDRRIWLPPHRRRLGYIFQEGRLFPHLTVRQNLLYGRWFAPKNDLTGDYDHVIDMLGIVHLLERRPAMLSGGEKQRVAIGRALLCGPQMILADEPLASLDENRKAEILPYFERIRDEARLPILYVSHSVSEVARLATTVIVIDQGKVIRVGPVAEVLGDPSFIQLMGVREAGSIIQGRVAKHHHDGLTEIATSAGSFFLPAIAAEPGSELRIRVNAQDVILARAAPQGLSALNILKGVVAQVRPGTGPGTMVQLKIGEDTLLARITKRSAEALGLEPGIECYAIAKTVSIAPMEVGRAAAQSVLNPDSNM